MGDAIAAASSSLANDSVPAEAAVAIEMTATAVTVTITGQAPGVLRGTSSAVSVVAAVALEGWVPL